MALRKPIELRFNEHAGKPERPVVEAILSFMSEAKLHGEDPPFTDQTIVATLSGDNTAASPGTAIATARPKGTQEIAGILIMTLPTPDSADIVGELAVHPRYRRNYVAQQLLRRAEVGSFLKKKFSHLPGDAPANIKFWAHGDSSAAQALAAKNGFSPIRKVWKMCLSDSSPLPPVPTPHGLALRPFAVGQDERAWVAVNSEAFATHPEQGAVTLEDLQAYEEEDWFDPKGLFVAVDSGGAILGFVWTKIENNRGEIYVLGISPKAQGRGLGKSLLLYGISYLRTRNVDGIFLHVDQDNKRAVEIYRRNGFVPCGNDVMYVKT